MNRHCGTFFGSKIIKLKNSVFKKMNKKRYKNMMLFKGLKFCIIMKTFINQKEKM